MLEKTSPSVRVERTNPPHLREMNEALIVSSVHQHELAEWAHKAEVAARESEERYRTLFDMCPAAVYSCYPSGVIQNFNRCAAELWGRAPAPGDTDERFCGSFKLYRPDGSYIPHEQCPMAEVLSGTIAETCNAEVIIERPDGSRVTVIVNIRPLKNQRGEVTGAINCFYDITDRKRAEEVMRQSHDRFEALFDTSPVGMYLVDAQLRLRQMSRKTREVFGDIGELNGRDFVEIVHILWPAKTADELLRHFRHVLKTGESYIAPEFSDERSDREVREYYDWQIHRIALPDGQYGVVCYFLDISEQMRLSDALRQNAVVLADLHRRKDEFLAMLSHELRNPLAPIANAVQLLRHQQEEAPITRQARIIIERQLGQLTRLVDDLMEVSRITTGRVQLRLERVAVNGIVERAVESAFPLIERHRHELAVELSPEPIWLDADASRLEQVVVNLLTNAAKYTAEGGQIGMTVRQEGTECVVRVRDTGVGIAPELLPRIFELFTQAERSLDRSQGGLGIGLALVQRIVEMHGGRAEAFSTLGVGSEFVVRLPAVTTEIRASTVLPIQAIQTGGPSLRILIVDDNQDAAESLDLLLQSLGHEVRAVHTGPAGLENALVYLPDVVLLDIGLPELDGLEVARRIRQNPGSNGVVLIAMTGYGQDDDRRLSREAGFDHHLVKPADFDAVLAILESVSPTRERGSQPRI